MSDREKILRYYRSSGDEDLAARLLDLAESALRTRRCKVSDFLDPFEFSIAETISAHYEMLELQADGAYPGAERQKAAFVSKEFLGNPVFGIQALTMNWDGRYYQITHRDVLGALMGMGVKREVLGDIIMAGDSCQVVVDATMAEFISANIPTIGSAPVTVQKTDVSEISPREEKVKEIRTTIASLRLDAVAAAGFGTSRSKMSDEITVDKVKVNWQQAKNSSQTIKQGDIISMRGRGRVEVCEILGETKKGRISIYLKRFI